MDTFISGLTVGVFLGAIVILGTLCALDATPGDMRQKLCAEAEWKLPSCVAHVEKAVNEAKGIRK
ncbi:MAG TPA: hypothetical protein VFE62_01290 [Gemmataceae bacterium]|nr:hypothetical protein [Gemmataceae bacterium]